MRDPKPQSSSLYIVKIAGNEFPYFNSMRFTSFSGINDETKTYSYISPFLHREFQIPGHRVYQPVTLVTPYVNKYHNKLFKSWNSYNNRPLQIKIEPIICGDKNGIETSLGYEIVLSGALWTSCSANAVDRLENKVSDVSLQFTFSGVEEISL